jgi:hypothetical protein
VSKCILIHAYLTGTEGWGPMGDEIDETAC